MIKKLFFFSYLIFFSNIYSQTELKGNLASALFLIPNIGLELFIGGGSSQSNYKYYNSDGNLEYDNPELIRNFSKSGEELIYRGGIMLVFKL